MRLGIVGAGAMVAEFLEHAAPRIEGLEVVGLLARPRSLENARELAARTGVGLVTDSVDELFGSGIDTVYVAVPNVAHVVYARDALERGLHVIVEKPMTSTVAEAEELAALAAERGLFLFEAITTVHLGTYGKVREWLPRVGDVKLVQSQYSQYSRRYDAFRSGEVLPAFDPAQSGGALMDLGLYNLHFVLGLFGEPESAVYTPNVERGIDTSGVLVLRYPTFVATCTAAKDSAGPQGGLIQGTAGRITTALSPNLVGEVRLELNDGTVETFDDGGAADRLAIEFRAFGSVIADDDRLTGAAWLADSLAVSRVQTAARLAAGIRFPADG
ncbi:Gfo/Idh/MocA family oxidoreductase [Cellulomonas sp. RIT-PI-Y]|uniref:Gfo/Idh/MocA family protein n=1 Tax=Cellulomonas sp. RIT-PI-Y TaxID=3035297 RepID=UPI0021D81692|nr:Gfo/Idh/MocA family oxidoreductase [Cellulomonas sp. RIT-PI-Y]